MLYAIHYQLPPTSTRDELLLQEKDEVVTCEVDRLDHSDVLAAYKTVIAACRKHKKWSGMGGIYAQAQMKAFVALGIQMVLVGSDLSFLMEAAAERAKGLRG